MSPAVFVRCVLAPRPVCVGTQVCILYVCMYTREHTRTCVCNVHAFCPSAFSGAIVLLFAATRGYVIIFYN